LCCRRIGWPTITTLLQRPCEDGATPTAMHAVYSLDSGPAWTFCQRRRRRPPGSRSVHALHTLIALRKEPLLDRCVLALRAAAGCAVGGNLGAAHVDSDGSARRRAAGFGLDSMDGTCRRTSCDAVLAGDALGLFPISSGRVDYGAQVVPETQGSSIPQQFQQAQLRLIFLEFSSSDPPTLDVVSERAPRRVVRSACLVLALSSLLLGES